MKVVVLGATGRMGREVIRQMYNHDDIILVGALTHKDSKNIGVDAGVFAGIEHLKVPITSEVSEEILLYADVLIDFSLQGGVEEHLKIAQKYGKPIVIGTTGLSKEDIFFMNKISRLIPILQSSNFSLGINILMRLVEIASKATGSDFKIDILEAHHKYKKDAPSGTALSLGSSIKNINEDACIDYHSVRGGDITGDHTVIFSGEGERLELKHQAHSRATFACGALKAARHLLLSPPGVYSMRDVLEAKI